MCKQQEYAYKNYSILFFLFRFNVDLITLYIPAEPPKKLKTIVKIGYNSNFSSNHLPKKNISTIVAANCVPSPK